MKKEEERWEKAEEAKERRRQKDRDHEQQLMTAMIDALKPPHHYSGPRPDFEAEFYPHHQ